MQLKITTKVDKEECILYLLEIMVGDLQVIKIGVTCRKIEDRVCEILTSFFKSYRYFPYLRPKRFRKTTDVYEKEAKLLEHFKEYKYEPDSRFSGSTELISGVDLDVVVEEYERLLNDEP